MRSPLLALIRKDLKGYFDQPTGYILIVIFAGLVSYLFFFITPFSTTQEASVRPLFGLMPWFLAVLVPLATMRLLAEEQRDGTLEILLTQPIRGWVVLLAKHLSGLAFVALAIIATVGIPIALRTAGDLDEGAIVAQYVGSLFLAASFVSIGLFTSSLTRNQIVAAILGLTLTTVLILLGVEIVAESLPPSVSVLLQDLSPLTHFETVARGVIDLRDGLYFIALVSTFLSATFLTIRAKSLSHRSVQYRNLQLGVAGLIVLSLLVGWFGSSIGGRLDMTGDKRFTLSPGTKQILSSLDDILTVTLYESQNPPAEVKLVARDVNDFLEDFAAGSRGKVRFIRKFPEKNEDVAREAQLTGVLPRQFNLVSQGELQIKAAYLGLAMTYLERREVISFIPSIDGLEYRLASLSNKMAQRDRKTVAFLTGHGERDAAAELRLLVTELDKQFEVKQVQATDGTPPDLGAVDALIIAGPTKAVPAATREALTRYLENGGKAMILIDSVEVGEGLRATPNRNSFADFVARYGVVVEKDLVFDVRSHETVPFSTQVGDVLLPYPYWIRSPTADPKVAGDVESAVLPWASSLGISESQVDRGEIIPLLQTTDFGAIDFNPSDVSPSSPKLNVTESNLVQSLVGVALAAPEAQGSFRLVVVGDSEWLTDALVSQNSNNLFLGLNLVDWLVQEGTLASIRSKVVSTRQLLFSSSLHRNAVQYANVVGVPLVLVVVGLVRFVRRRNMGLRIYSREK